jgi:S-adenosylmethionine:tRNA ribosyltransferase-isomerase
MHIDDFDFELPRELIALHPCEPRDAARLLVIPASGGFEDRRISDLPALLHPGDLLVFNDTKVIPARLTGRRGAAVVATASFSPKIFSPWPARSTPRVT